MPKTLEKIKERLEEELKLADGVKEKCARENPLMFDNAKGYSTGISNALHIVNQVAKEFAADINVGRKDGWIPIEESLPDTDRLVLISFVNYGVPQIGRYREDEEGGAFYLGDEDVPMSKYGIMVNAWMELPRCYEDK